MIELKPYKGTTAATVEKNDKKQLGGSVSTGREAYAWHRSGWLVGTVGCLMLAGLMVTILMVTTTESPAFFCLFALACGVMIYAVNIGWKWYIGQYVGQPSLRVSSERAARGDEIEVIFRQPFHRDMMIENTKIELLAREWVRYKCGTDTCTATHDHTIDSQSDARNRTVISGQTHEYRVRFIIPAAAMHSFAFSDNSLTWLLRVTLDSQNFMTLTETYAIQVTPEVHTL